ncbi:hypothetical protein FEM48_Zijuj10G0008900 [Ziziphus jujuba var. spinosa]|uniref:Disease resistance RPP13-like protein 1 n=1 Tax=Ziziphus jujuba var. spinosa TaxID=714518 RepID=A0A978UKB7_ZIZJJ|nr:hypothetical protein FEM48_Zijuj10G0008900 [Ziziphus jujuba var. spinosa]
MKVHHLVVVSHVSNKTLDSVLRTAQLRTLLPSSSNSFDYLSNGAVNQLGRTLPIFASARRTALPQNSLLKQLDGVVRVNEEVYGTNGKFSSLESLSFSSMSTWKEWNSTEVGVKDGEVFPKLQELCIIEGCEKLTNLPGQMPYLLPSLKKLLIINCPQVKSFPAGGLPSNLNGLLVDKCSKLIAKRKEWNLQTLSALEYFDVKDESDANMESFPEMGLLPSCLTSFRVGPLESLQELDMKQLQQLTSLKSLDIQSYPELTTLKFGKASEAPT